MAHDPVPMALDPHGPDSMGLWGPVINGAEVCRLQRRLGERVPSDEFDAVVQTAADILGQCPEPTQTRGSITGLALGKIQSGKTLSYTTLIALAMDNGYRITVVLAGTKTSLLEQNFNRLSTDLETGARPNVTLFKNAAPMDTQVMAGVLHGRGHVLIVALKHRGRLEDLRRVFAAPELRGYPTLIIDDEGDEASLNTQFRRGAKSAVYARIIRLRETLPMHAYVAYTATPQANLLISGIDGLSPDFGVLVEPGVGYCGGTTFFGPDRDRYVRIVPVTDIDADDPRRLPVGMKVAIAEFLVGAAFRHLREPDVWHSMLIHNSNLRVDHQALWAGLQDLLGLWRDSLSLSNSDPAAHDLLQLLRNGYDDLCGTVVDAPSWDEIRAQVDGEIWSVEAWMVNSLAMGRDPVGTPFRLRNNILVGGNMLGRGVTIPGLAVTYITRRAQRDTNADTMEQRARWFGYKTTYLDLCRIFLTTQLCEDYTGLLRHEDDFWEALRRNQRQGLSIREWPRMFELDTDMGLKPTRSSVADFREFRGHDWDVQKRLVEDGPIAAHNLEVEREFFRKHGGVLLPFGNVEHLVVRDCPTQAIITELLGRVSCDGTDWDNSYTREYLTRLFLAGVLPTVDVVFMSKGELRERTKKDGQVNPMQGRSPGRQPTDPAFYPGDEHIHDGRVQLQVHAVSLGGAGVGPRIHTSAFALFVPRGERRFDLRYVVRQQTP